MNLVFTINDENAYLLMKQEPGWELRKWMPERISQSPKSRGKLVQAGWVRMAKGGGVYPHTIQHARDRMTSYSTLSQMKRCSSSMV